MNKVTTAYVAKHLFHDNAAQSQLNFPAGATITSRQGQEGNAWWWGSYLGKEGWYPPNYVTPLQPNAIASQQQQLSMQQQATFASSTTRQQQQQPNVMRQPQQQQQQQQYSMNSTAAAFGGMSYGMQ